MGKTKCCISWNTQADMPKCVFRGTSERPSWRLFNENVVMIALHYSDVTMSIMAFQLTGNSTVCSTVCLGKHQRKHLSLRHWPFVRRIHRWPEGSLHKGPVTHKSFHIMPSWWMGYVIDPFSDILRDDKSVIMTTILFIWLPCIRAVYYSILYTTKPHTSIFRLYTF